MTTRAIDFFDVRASQYDRRLTKGLWGITKRYELSRISDMLGTRTFERALDLGCGTGYYEKHLLQTRAKEIVCVDASRQMLDQVPSGKFTVVRADAHTFSDNAPFNLVICLGVLEFSRSPTELLRNIRSHLAPDGTAIILVPLDILPGLFYRTYHRSHGVNINLFSKAGLRHYCASSGLRILKSGFLAPFNYILECVPEQ